jgi:hypothetical protein
MMVHFLCNWIYDVLTAGHPNADHHREHHSDKKCVSTARGRLSAVRAAINDR